MTFYYHMYGASMGCVVIYIKSQASNRLKPVWLRSQDQGNHWITGRISINETLSYQVSYNFCLQHLIYKKQKYNGTCHALVPCHQTFKTFAVIISQKFKYLGLTL